MPTRRALLALLLVACAGVPAAAQERIKAVASFSILGDLVRNVGGERVDVVTLVGPNSDAHVYEPSPADARRIGDAKVVFINGLGYEGWIERLVTASGTHAPVVTVTRGVSPRTVEQGVRNATDPHAWQSVGNAKIYVGNIRDALAAADPAGKGAYAENAAAYLARLDALDAEVRAAVAGIPPERRKVITTHSAFGYFGAAYGMDFIAPIGVSTESEPSARDVAMIIAQIKRQRIPAVFLENVSDPRLVRRIAQETGAAVGETIYSDALSDAAGGAPTYIDMIRHNIRALSAALAG